VLSRSCHCDNSGLMCPHFWNMLLFMFKIIAFFLVTLFSQLRVRVGILLTCKEHLQDRIISLRGEVWALISTSIPPPFIVVPVPFHTLLIQKRWRWLGHVLRKPSEDMTKVALRWTSEGKRQRGRPKTTWRRTIENEIKERGYTWGTIERKANNREEWRKLVLALCAMKHSKD